MRAISVWFYCCFLVGHVQAQSLAITNARLLDGTGSVPLDNVTIVVQNNRISSVSSADIDLDEVTVIDAEGRTVMPGLAELHVHSSVEFLIDADLLGDFENENPDLFYPPADSMFQNDDDIALFIEERLPRRLQRFLEAGITTIVDPGGFWPWIVEVRDRERSGELLAPRMFVVGRLFTSPTGHPGSTVCHNRDWCVNNLVYNTDDPEVARSNVRELVASGVDGIKIIADHEPEPRIHNDIIYAVVHEAHKHRLPVIAHAFEIDDFELLIDAGVDAFVHGARTSDGSFRTSTGRYLPDVMVQHDVPMTTTYRFIADSEDVENVLVPSVRALMDAGVVMLFGTDFEGMGLDPDPRDNVLAELEALQLAGLSNREILRIMGENSARHPMTPVDIGMIAPEKLADMIIVEGDPLLDITAITFPVVVIKDGRVVVDRR